MPLNMADIFARIRNLFNYSSTEERICRQNRKRRLTQEAYENYSAKIRRFNDMSGSNDGWHDIPASLKNAYLLHFPHREDIIRKVEGRRSGPSRHIFPEPVYISDDDDIIEVTPRRSPLSVPPNGSSIYHRSNGSAGSSRSRSPKSPPHALLEARRSIHNYNKYQNGHANNSIRPDEQELYRHLLLSSPTTSAVYGHTISASKKTDYMENNRGSKILALLRDKSSQSLIDLTADEKVTEKGAKTVDSIIIKDSDSETDSINNKKKISPVNSLKKLLDTEPVMHVDYLDKLEAERFKRRKEIQRQIEEQRLKREKFRSLNHENVNLLLESKVKYCKISDVIILEDVEEKLVLPDFTSDQETRIEEAFNCRSASRVFVDKYRLSITANDLKLLKEKQWLNDELINFYVNMIQERSQNPNLPKVYSFSTFFYPKLITNGHSSLRRWTKRVDIFSFDIIVVPVHLGYHWCMAIIDFRDKSIRYYDSMLGHNMQCLNALETYLIEEHRDKKKTEYDMSSWKKVIMNDIPRQMNGSDCGVFSCTFAEFITRNAKILFTQEHMPYIRKKMCIEIIEGRLLT